MSCPPTVRPWTAPRGLKAAQNQYVLQECDRVTRETGRLTKMVTINDMNHVSLMRGVCIARARHRRFCCCITPALVRFLGSQSEARCRIRVMVRAQRDVGYCARA